MGLGRKEGAGNKQSPREGSSGLVLPKKFGYPEGAFLGDLQALAVPRAQGWGEVWTEKKQQ